jgi:RNA methyltransferase, TrmH family
LERPAVQAIVARLQQDHVPLASASAMVMEAASPVQSASGIVALADRPGERGKVMYSAPDPLVAVAFNIQDPGNLGAIVRVTEAAGGTGLVVAGASADPFGWKALRGSMGSALRLPVTIHNDGAAAVAAARHAGCRVLATVPRGGTPLTEAVLTDPVAILIGGEGSGLTSEMVEAADGCLTVPMAAPVESLNAAVTAALILYEARRQREGARRKG